MWELWSKKCKDGSQNVNWIVVYTMPCPKCQKPVEKKGGCNRVSCVCWQSFCWLCGRFSKDHFNTTNRDHDCGRYWEDGKKKYARRDLVRFAHYHGRYKAHTDSFKLESKLKETIQEKILKLEERESTYTDFSWITDGLYGLFRLRRVLSYSYPFAYFMFSDEEFGDEMTKDEWEIKQNLFVDQQQQFEANVEKLSSVLEEQFDLYSEDEVMDLRMRIIALSGATDNLCRNLFKCIETDLLGSVKGAIHKIAPYNSKGVEKASELPNCWESLA